MGYKKSFNLVTLQLIIPLSTMTKEEYKNTYGIDLDDIDIEKVTLLQDEGSENKYFVDEVKTTENGVDVYAGGNILSIGETSVSVTKNAYSVENAKPIYYHPVYLGSDDVEKYFRIQLVILDNNPTPYTKDTILAKLKELMDLDAIININGPYRNDLNDSFNHSYMLLKSETTYKIFYFSGTALSNESLSFFETHLDVVIDGVNKIN